MGQYKHGLSKHPLNRRWYGIKDRCYNKNDERYPRYGGIGVRMCDEWLNDFISFYNWCISNGWESGMQIDKDIKARKAGIEPLLYSPEWCSIVTGTQNANSKRNNTFLEYNGEVKTIAEWSRETGINHFRISARLRLGWPTEKILTTLPGTAIPKKPIKGKFYEFDGVSKNIKDWAREVGVEFRTLWYRLNKGWSIERALTEPVKNKKA